MNIFGVEYLKKIYLVESKSDTTISAYKKKYYFGSDSLYTLISYNICHVFFELCFHIYAHCACTSIILCCNYHTCQLINLCILYGNLIILAIVDTRIRNIRLLICFVLNSVLKIEEIMLKIYSTFHRYNYNIAIYILESRNLYVNNK